MTQCYIKTEESKLTPEQKFRRAKDLAAFPVNVYEGHTKDGMTLRDYFAAKAMQSFIKISRDNYNHGNPSEGGCSWVSEMAYKQADAMLKARDAE